MAGTNLTKSMGAFTSRSQWCMSYWIKRSSITSDHRLYTSYYDSNNFSFLRFNSADLLEFANFNNGSYDATVRTNRKFRDTNAFYHIFLLVDTTQATASDRVGLYVNGEKETSLAASTYPSQNGNINLWNTGFTMYIGSGQTNSQNFDGIMTHIHHVDGTSEPVSKFGETDSTTGIWKPKTSPSISEYGNNGVFLDMADSSAMGNDVSGKNNDFTVSNGTLTQTIDTPSNVFATLSPNILPRNSGETIKNGNLFFGTSAAIWNTESSAFGISKGKYYFEVKLNDNGSDRRFRWGLQKEDTINTTGENKVLGGSGNDAIGYKTQGESATQGGYFINQVNTDLTDGDINVDGAIYGFAIDLDNQRMYGHMNGTYFHSGNPSAGTGGIDVSSFYTVGETLFPSFTVHNANIEINFGNGYFGTTAVASAGTNAGVGTFEYDVPTGFKALCTKSINEQEYS